MPAIPPIKPSRFESIEPKRYPSHESFQAIASRLICAEQERLDAMILELRQRVTACSAAIATGHVPAIKEAIHYLLDAEYELTGDSQAFGFLYDQYGITDSEYERHFERVEAARKAAKPDETTNVQG
jgi:hypothetical protein